MKPGHPAARPSLPAEDATFRAFDTIVDTRSPAEFAEDHVPGAISCPVLDNEERARVGTIYKQESPYEAKKLGAALVARNIARHIEENFAKKEKNWKPLVYCWRGGKRSGAMAHVLREVGWDAKTLEGGYKAYRRYVVDSLAKLPARFTFRVHIGSPEEKCLYNEVLDFEFTFLDLLMDPLMARIEPARMPGHCDHACLFLRGGNSFGVGQ